MANYTACKIYLEKRTGVLDLEEIKDLITRLKEENRIYENIEIYVCHQSSSLEIRFGMKWFPQMIDEIFLEDYEVWMITSDEGGMKDHLHYFPHQTSFIEETSEKVLYKFDEIELRGDVGKIKEYLKAIFGWGIAYFGYNREIKDGVVRLELSGIYTSNNYFYNPSEEQINFHFVESLPFRDKPNDWTHFGDFIWNTEGIEFQTKFYEETLLKNGNSAFDYLSSIRFNYKGKLTNEFTWDDENWKHTAINDFHNCVNANFLMFRKLKELAILSNFQGVKPNPGLE